MKKMLLLSVLPFFMACHKGESPAPALTYDATKNYTVEGVLLSSNTHTPIQYRGVAVAQGDTASLDDASAMTDSMGYFKITYQPSNQQSGLILHFGYPSYSCLYLYDIAILTNIAKGTDINLGKIYVPMY